MLVAQMYRPHHHHVPLDRVLGRRARDRHRRKTKRRNPEAHNHQQEFISSAHANPIGPRPNRLESSTLPRDVHQARPGGPFGA